MARTLTLEEKEARKKAYAEKFCKKLGCDMQRAVLFYDNSVKTRLEREMASIKRLIDIFGLHAADVYLDRNWINTLIELHVHSTEDRTRGIVMRRINAILKGKRSQQKFLPHIPDMSTVFKIAMYHNNEELEAIIKIQNIEKRRRQIEALIEGLKKLEKTE